MKRLKTILLFLVICISCFAQNASKRPSKFDGWVISDAFQVEDNRSSILKCLLKEPTYTLFQIAIDKEGRYYLIVELYDQISYLDILFSNESILCLKTDEEENVNLYFLNGNKQVYKFYNEGRYLPSNNIWIPGRFVTGVMFYIPDIDKFLFNYYVKYRIRARRNSNLEEYIELNNNFNYGLRNAAREVTSEYKAKQKKPNSNTVDEVLESILNKYLN